MTKKVFDQIADGLKELERQIDEHFPESSCPATRAVEGIDHHKRKDVERHRRDKS